MLPTFSPQQALQSFAYGETPIRMVVQDGEPWWCAVDICGVLGYINGRKALADHCTPKGVRKYYTPTNGGIQSLSYINESNLYRLAARSNLPNAVKFETWIFEDVLPNIRKTGSYSLPADPIDQVIMMAEKLKEQALAHRAALTLVEEQRPKVELAEQVLSAQNAQTMAIVAKELGIGRNKLFSLLREKRILMAGTNVPYQRYIDAGYFQVKLQPLQFGVTNKNIAVTYVLPKGLSFITRTIKEASCVTSVTSV